MTFEEAYKRATLEATKAQKVVVEVLENDEYWLFKAAREDGRVDKDNGVGSVFVAKGTGELRDLRPWNVDFIREFYDTAKPVVI